MNRMKNTRQGLAVLVDLNWDRFLYAGALALALGASVVLHSLV